MERSSFYKLVRPLIIIIYAFLGVLAFKFIMDYLIKWIFPFIIGFLLSRIALILARFFKRKLRFGNRFADILASIIVILICIGLFVLLIYGLLSWLLPFSKRLTEIYSNAGDYFSDFWARIQTFLERFPPEVKNTVNNAVNGIPKNINFVDLLVMPILRGAGSLPLALLSFIASAVSTVFFVIFNKDINAFLKKLIPATLLFRIGRTYEHMKKSLGSWFKAQIIMCSVCFAELFVGFLILGLKSPIMLAAIIAFVDFLPVLGAGGVLIPWALISLAIGNFKLAIGLAVIYVVILIVRNTIEPNVLGLQIGMNPLVTLFGIYFGFRIYGFLGMLVVPIILITIIQLNSWGYIHFWKTSPPPPDPKDEIISIEKP